MIKETDYFLTVRELAARIRAKKLSPVELAEGVIQRLESTGKKLNAVVTVMRESGLREARAAEAEIAKGKYRGMLHGIPYGVKDLVATREAPTTWGAQPYRDQRFDYDAARNADPGFGGTYFVDGNQITLRLGNETVVAERTAKGDITIRGTTYQHQNLK